MLNHEMSSNCRAAVVIPCLNEKDLIISSLESVGIASGSLAVSGLVEVIYVDGKSTDTTISLIEKFADEHAGIGIASQPRRGIGHARRLGASLALTRAAKRPYSVYEDFWIISTDADVAVPENWLIDWFKEFESPSSLLIAGNDSFSSTFIATHPNIAHVLTEVRKRIEKAMDVFGPINLQGTNSAIERKAYAAIGPFEQPHKINEEGRIENLPGEDWDMGTRARYAGMSVGLNTSTPVAISARRFEHNKEEFFSGQAYSKEFLRVNPPTNQSDILPSEITQKIAALLHLRSMYYVSKPILVDTFLLEKPNVIDFLGQDTTKAMRIWIKEQPRPDLLNDRNSFMLDYIASFHDKFGNEISARLLRST